MPNIGLSQMYVAKRNYDESAQTVTYSDGMRLGRAVNFSTDITTADSNNFYADNNIAESVTGEFTSGTLTCETAEFTNEVSMLILGLTANSIEVNGQTYNEILYGSNPTPELGFGVIKKQRIHGADKWTAVILPRISFGVPSEDVNTQGEEIEWQTETAEATIMREQQGGQLWQRRATFNAEADAAAYIMGFLNVVPAVTTLSSLTLGSLTLAPAFSSSVQNYTTTTSNATNTITATATGPSAEIIVTVNGSAVPNGSAATWNEGSNVVAVVVTNGAASMTYTVTVTKEI